MVRISIDLRSIKLSIDNLSPGGYMRKFVVLFISLILISLPFVSQSEEMASKKPTVYAVMMHADWCGTCKAMGPKIAQARVEGELDSKDVLFVKLDLTNKQTKHQAAMMAEILGFSELYESNAGKTGYMLLIDAKTGKKITSITNKSDVAAIASKINDTVKGKMS